MIRIDKARAYAGVIRSLMGTDDPAEFIESEYVRGQIELALQFIGYSDIDESIAEMKALILEGNR